MALPWRPASAPTGRRRVRGSPGAVAAFDKVRGDVLWTSLDDPHSYSSPIAVRIAGVAQLVFFTGLGLVGLAAQDGNELWRFPWETNDYCNIATPVAVGNYL